MSAKTKARVNLVINLVLAAIGTVLPSLAATDTWQTVTRPIYILAAAVGALGVLRAAFGASPSTGE